MAGPYNNKKMGILNAGFTDIEKEDTNASYFLKEFFIENKKHPVRVIFYPEDKLIIERLRCPLSLEQILNRILKRTSSKTVRLADIIGICETDKDTFQMVIFEHVKESLDHRKSLLRLTPLNTNSALSTKLMEEFGECKNPFISEDPLLVIVNTMSGNGNALNIFESSVRPLFQVARIPIEVKVLESKEDSIGEMIPSFLSRKWSGIVMISGDGLLHAIIQMIANTCPELFQTLPFGIIPAGSGNGLVNSILRYNDQSMNTGIVFSSLLNIIRGSPRPIDLARVEGCLSGKRYYCFLSIGWGFLAEVDIHSEVLRFMGRHRFTLWLFRYLLFDYKTFKGKLSYRKDYEWTTVEGPFLNVYAVLQSTIAKNSVFAPKSELDDGLIYLSYIKAENVSKKNILDFCTKMNIEGSHLNCPFFEMIPVTQFELIPYDSDGLLVLDGETVSTERIQVQMLKSHAKIFNIN